MGLYGSSAGDPVNLATGRESEVPALASVFQATWYNPPSLREMDEPGSYFQTALIRQAMSGGFLK